MPVLQNKRALTVVAGVSGSGKSTLARRYLINAPLDVRFIFDLEGDFSQDLQIPAVSEPYGLIQLEDPRTLLRRSWALFNPEEIFPGQFKEAFAFFCDWVFALSGRIPGRKCLMVDEARRYQDNHSMTPELARCILEGRKRGLEVLLCIQSPNKLNNEIWNEVTEFVCFRVQSESAKGIVEKWGLDPEEISRLPDYEFISRTNAGAELRGRIKV